jgi:hypothetical protein
MPPKGRTTNADFLWFNEGSFFMNSRSSVTKLTAGLVGTLLPTLAVPTTLFSRQPKVLLPQTATKTVTEAWSSNPQVKINQVKTGDQVRKFKESFDGPEDWLRTLTFTVENTSTQPIVYLQINLNFPDTSVSGSMMSYSVVRGLKPKLDASGLRPAFKLMPGETAEISVGDEYEQLAKFIAYRHQMYQINQVEIVVQFIVFANGIAWSVGDFMKQDPNNPRRYLPAGRTMPGGSL